MIYVTLIIAKWNDVSRDDTMGLFGRRLGITRYEADEYYRMALEAYTKNNLEDAVYHITSAIDLYPKRAEYYATRGFFRLEDGLTKEAEPDFDQALAFHEYDMLGNYGKGVVEYSRDSYDRALEYFMKAWALDPERPETMYYLALCEHRLQNNNKAKDWMEQVLSIYDDLEESDREVKKRKSNAEKWIKSFDKLIAEEAKAQAD